MNEKKSFVITFRCTENTKLWLEDEAERRGWTVAKLAGYIIDNFASDKEDEWEDDAKDIFTFIQSDKCNNLIDLSKWAIANNKTGEVSRSLEIWDALIKELKKQKD